MMGIKKAGEKQVLVKLRRGHPSRVMRARLTSGDVVEIKETGIVIAASEVSREMQGCKWWEIEAVEEKQDAPGEKQTAGGNEKKATPEK
jgi:uncharacterized protein YodC (DUF2158 family)